MDLFVACLPFTQRRDLLNAAALLVLASPPVFRPVAELRWVPPLLRPRWQTPRETERRGYGRCHDLVVYAARAALDRGQRVRLWCSSSSATVEHLWLEEDGRRRDPSVECGMPEPDPATYKDGVSMAIAEGYQDDERTTGGSRTRTTGGNQIPTVPGLQFLITDSRGRSHQVGLVQGQNLPASDPRSLQHGNFAALPDGTLSLGIGKLWVWRPSAGYWALVPDQAVPGVLQQAAGLQQRTTGGAVGRRRGRHWHVAAGQVGVVFPWCREFMQSVLDAVETAADCFRLYKVEMEEHGKRQAMAQGWHEIRRAEYVEHNMQAHIMGELHGNERQFIETYRRHTGHGPITNEQARRGVWAIVAVENARANPGGKAQVGVDRILARPPWREGWRPTAGSAHSFRDHESRRAIDNLALHVVAQARGYHLDASLPHMACADCDQATRRRWGGRIPRVRPPWLDDSAGMQLDEAARERERAREDAYDHPPRVEVVAVRPRGPDFSSLAMLGPPPPPRGMLSLAELAGDFGGGGGGDRRDDYDRDRDDGAQGVAVHLGGVDLSISGDTAHGLLGKAAGVLGGVGGDVAQGLLGKAAGVLGAGGLGAGIFDGDAAEDALSAAVSGLARMATGDSDEQEIVTEEEIADGVFEGDEDPEDGGGIGAAFGNLAEMAGDGFGGSLDRLDATGFGTDDDDDPCSTGGCNVAELAETEP